MKYIYREREIISEIEIREYVVLENFSIFYFKYKKKKFKQVDTQKFF